MMRIKMGISTVAVIAALSCAALTAGCEHMRDGRGGSGGSGTGGGTIDPGSNMDQGRGTSGTGTGSGDGYSSDY